MPLSDLSCLWHSHIPVMCIVPGEPILAMTVLLKRRKDMCCLTCAALMSRVQVGRPGPYLAGGLWLNFISAPKRLSVVNFQAVGHRARGLRLIFISALTCLCMYLQVVGHRSAALPADHAAARRLGLEPDRHGRLLHLLQRRPRQARVLQPPGPTVQRPRVCGVAAGAQHGEGATQGGRAGGHAWVGLKAAVSTGERNLLPHRRKHRACFLSLHQLTTHNLMSDNGALEQPFCTCDVAFRWEKVLTSSANTLLPRAGAQPFGRLLVGRHAQLHHPKVALCRFGGIRRFNFTFGSPATEAAHQRPRPAQRCDHQSH